MNNILEMKKRKQETKQEDDFDPKAWKWPTVVQALDAAKVD